MTEAQHTAAEEVFKKYGVGEYKAEKINGKYRNEISRENWAKMFDGQRRAIITESLKAANVPDSVIRNNQDKIMAGATPGNKTSGLRRASPNGRVITRVAMDEAAQLAKVGTALGGLLTMNDVSYADDASMKSCEDGELEIMNTLDLMRRLRLTRNGDIGLPLHLGAMYIKYRDAEIRVSYDYVNRAPYIIAQRVTRNASGKISDLEYIIRPGELSLESRPRCPITARLC